MILINLTSQLEKNVWRPLVKSKWKHLLPLVLWMAFSSSNIPVDSILPTILKWRIYISMIMQKLFYSIFFFVC